MKKIFLILMITAVAAGAVFANGTQEKNEDGVVVLEPGMYDRSSSLDDLKKVDVKGKLTFESPVPELTAGGKTYTLVAPGAMQFISYVKEGDTLTVHGYILEDDNTFFGGMFGGRGGRGMMYDNSAVEGNINLLVESVEYNGTTYQLPWVGDDDDFCGPGYGGMRGGFDRGGSYGRMPGYGGMMGGTSSGSFGPGRRF